MVVIKKGRISREKKEQEAERTKVKADHVQAVTDYNMMMGILEDPSEGGDDE